MVDRLHLSEKANRRIKSLFSILFLLLLLWIARYWHFKEFGLYEDDLTIIPKVMGMNGSQYLNLLVDHLSMLYPHGRPLSNSFEYTFTFLGGGNDFIDLYLMGFAIVSINVCLFYWLLKRLFNHSFALIGGIAFVLFSADTTQAFLTHSHQIHPSLMFLLLGLHSYLSGRRTLMYIFGVLILLTYETPFFMLLVAPLFKMQWDKKLLKEFSINAAILVLIIGGMYVFRSQVGDFRSIEPSFQNLVVTPILHMIEGPAVALGTYFYRPVQALMNIRLEIIVAVIVGFLLIYAVVDRTAPEGWEGVQGLVSSIRTEGFPSFKYLLTKRRLPYDLPEDIQKFLKLLVIGAALLVLAYPLTFTIRAYAISGRDTRVHIAAVIGAAMIWACVGWLLLALAESFGKRRIAAILFSVIFAFLVGYGFVIQKDYIDAWKYQQEFWTELTQITSDADEGTVILVDPVGLKDVRQIGANTWNLPRVLDQIYVFPSEWENPPRVYRLIPGWQERIVDAQGQFIVNAATVLSPAPLYRVVPSTDVIFIETSSGHLQRGEEPLVLSDTSYDLYHGSSPSRSYEENILYEFLIGDE
ncbi:MAG: hypothetical protein P8Z34_14415 [Anaerolineales bacterium]|jgi:hypothetical protein